MPNQPLARLLITTTMIATMSGGCAAVPQEKTTMPTPQSEHRNRLIHEKSPYLLQHADNPVDWYPWGDEAFERALSENKPVFLSIGYSSCHWCHVMEHESFEDAEVAAAMNAAFVNIKVDREERPDIDDVYMTVAQMMTGRGGWPLNVVMTPQKVPFFAATYIPKENRWGQVGMLTLIREIQGRWKSKRQELLNIGGQVTSALEQMQRDTSGADMDEGILDKTFQQLAGRFDAQHGGFGSRPKFPTPHNLLFLLRYWRRTGNSQALRMVEQTLQAMRQGGVFDQIGFGFHRYSTDAEWLLPHFEKMLYDQALLTMAYTEAYQATGNATYRRTAEQILTYVLRDMRGPSGGFFSAEDADSEGEEGKYYLWTLDELRQILGPDADLVVAVCGVRSDGNFADEATGKRTGSNILHLGEALSEMAARLGMPEEELSERVDGARQALFAHREERVHPLKDDKVLTDWNGLMIAALAKAARTFGSEAYAQAAAKAVGFSLSTLVREDGRLLHRYRDGEAAVLAYAADYAFLTWGLLELYEATFDTHYLNQAIRLNEAMLEHYWDEEGGGLFSTADDGEALLVRQKEVYDGAIPSANSVAMLNLLRLARLTAQPELERRAAEIGRAFSGSVSPNPGAHTQLMMAVDFAVGPSLEVVIAGELGADDTEVMLQTLTTEYVPNKVVVHRPEGEAAEIIRLAPYAEFQTRHHGQATAYVCRNHTCEFPTTDPEVMRQQLRAGSHLDR
jgi:uncharacterized protein YyaL (SSP411 family)